jgi:hypothetical protein
MGASPAGHSALRSKVYCAYTLQYLRYKKRARENEKEKMKKNKNKKILLVEFL